jgi:hypothetical protein
MLGSGTYDFRLGAGVETPCGSMLEEGTGTSVLFAFFPFFEGFGVGVEAI